LFVSRVNDVVVKIGTVNGTGSASANGLLLKSIFRMGIPVVGKNYFPSNIQGLPTWYEVRVTGEGFQARSDRVDIMVAMNAQTYAKDLAEVASGGWLVYDSTWPRSNLLAEDITVFGVRCHVCATSISTAPAKNPDEEYAYARRRRGVAGYRSRHHKQPARRPLRKAMVKQSRDAIHWLAMRRNFAVVAGQGDEQDHGPHHDRRQYGRGIGLRLRRSNRRCLVSDYAVDVADGCLQRHSASSSEWKRKPTRRSSALCRQKTSLPRSV
jgi:Pyruvate/2-oxoacid:ferredoxin oxidoreductase gamma subunit